MIPFHLGGYEQELDRQAIHMDQGLCYCPEFRASRSMSDYPSRKAQLVRALHFGELPPSRRAAEILFHSILSRQGERWQVFQEPPDAYTEILILGRQALLHAGYGWSPAEELHRRVLAQEGSILRLEGPLLDGWKERIPVSARGTDWLFLDEASALAAAGSSGRLGALLRRGGIRLQGEVQPQFGGWEYFAYGMVEEGVRLAKKMVQELQDRGIRRIVTLSGQGAYIWRHFFPKVGVDQPFAVVDIMELGRRLELRQRAYLYAGSFYTRYLLQAELFNRLLPHHLRANTVDIWQKPFCAEYLLLHFPRETEERIFADALQEVRSCQCERLVVFEPFAYHRLKQAGFGDALTYFTDVLA